MIGVLANPAEHDTVREFFELFKTPWEFYRPGAEYEVLLCTADATFDSGAAKLVLVYGGRKLSCDSEGGIQVVEHSGMSCDFSYDGRRIPIFGDSITFPAEPASELGRSVSGFSAARVRRTPKGILVRVGYQLFDEIKYLLTKGQPIGYAGVPTLELHIALLRDLIVSSGALLMEIPPVPEGFPFIACLTHDVDHPILRSHRFDHTMFGFLYRATLGTLLQAIRRQWPARKLLRNILAVAKLPLVYLGVARDFWTGFDRYPRLENGARSSFFVIPFKDYPGQTANGPAPERRAARYEVAEVEPQLRRLLDSGCEIGAHGIDAWRDSSATQAELEEIRRITGGEVIGVRMHWLYFDEQSPATLEKGGADYDSTVGYNQTVGYRAGTSQAYKPLGVTRLLELPLHIMDTALFYPDYLNLSPREAGKRVAEIIGNAVVYGGCVTVNWHDRSIAPERCWDDFYRELVGDLASKGAWFATAAEAVSWFRKRRSVRLEGFAGESNLAGLKTSTPGDGLPDLSWKVHNLQQKAAIPCDK